jgi:hypothetical protein
MFDIRDNIAQPCKTPGKISDMGVNRTTKIPLFVTSNFYSFNVKGLLRFFLNFCVEPDSVGVN